MEEFDPDKILLIRLSSIGDIILTTPVIRALGRRYPGAKIDFLTKQEFSGILRFHPQLDSVESFDSSAGFSGLRNLCREVRSRRYDLMVDLHGNLRSTYLRFFGGARIVRRYGKRSIKRQMLKRFRINLLGSAESVIDRYFTSLSDLGVSNDGLGPEIFLDESSRLKADQVLGKTGAAGDPVVIGLAPGASRATKRWPAERFAEAALALADKIDLRLVLLGGGKDRGIAQEVIKALPGGGKPDVLNLSGELKLLETAAVMERLDLLISNDTALMHMATAVKTPVVAIFGPTSRELGFFPFGDNARVVEIEGLECRPCSLHGDDECPKGHFKCMNDISADHVAREAMYLLGVAKGNTV